MFTIAEPGSMALAHACAIQYEPFRLMSITLRNSSGDSRVAGTAVPIPALLTSTSIRPRPSTVSCTALAHWSGSETSHDTAIALRPSSST